MGEPLQRNRSATAAAVLSLSSHDRNWATRITEGQLQAVALRCREELEASLRRTGTRAVASLQESVLTVEVEHSLSAAEHHLMRKETGREFFQHYIEELAEQMYPTFAHHVQQILSCAVRYTRVRVDCERDSIIFQFGVRPSSHWGEILPEADRPVIYHG
ncbi:MAG: Na-translocating system protein MpsC family protein [Caldilineaceae bacterium]